MNPSPTSPPITPTEADLATLPPEALALIRQLRSAAASAASDAEAREITNRVAQLVREYKLRTGVGLPAHPAAQAEELDPQFRIRAHLELLSQEVASATRAVERGENRLIAVEMPPRAGKSTLLSVHTPLWLLRRHPEWKIITVSHDGSLTNDWARTIRRAIEERPELGIALARDSGAGGRWQTREGGGIYSSSIRSSLTGRGAKVMIIDDPIKDAVDATSALMRQNLWNWWLSVAQTRLEPPYLVLVVMTRWHEDDFVGRLLSRDHEGDPASWQNVLLPALSEGPDSDAMGRAEGEPLIAPYIEETPAQARQRWLSVKTSVGSYTFASMYQQRPAPAKGAIFDVDWWRFWTTEPAKATTDGRVRTLDVNAELSSARWLDSWDCSFKGDAESDWVVGQRWARSGPDRFLIAQKRGRWSFTETLSQMRAWTLASAAPLDAPASGISPATLLTATEIPEDGDVRPALPTSSIRNVATFPARGNLHGVDPANPYGHLVHETLVEEAANGAAIIDTLRTEISGLRPIRAVIGKEARARAITPEAESGHVYLPHPTDPGNAWVSDLLSELRNFPFDAHDDQVDALSQALLRLRTTGRGQITVPGDIAASASSATPLLVPLNRAAAARTDTRRTAASAFTDTRRSSQS